MKKVVRLTEADLARIVKRVIKEQAPTDVYNPSTMGRVSGEPRMDKPKSNEFDWKSHFDQIKNELDSYLNTIEGPVNLKRFQSKVRNAYYGMVSNVDDEYSYPSHGDDFIQLTDEYMSYFRNKLKNLVQKYGKLTESDLARIVKRVIKEQEKIELPAKELKSVIEPAKVAQIKSQANVLAQDTELIKNTLELIRKIDPESYRMITKGQTPDKRTILGDVIIGGTLLSLIYTIMQELKGQ
jgi:hypothetical protein